MSWPATLADFEYFINEDPCSCNLYKKGSSTTIAATFTGRMIPYVTTGEERQAVSRIGSFTTVARGWVLCIMPQVGIDFEKEDEIEVTYASKRLTYRVQDVAYFPEHTEVSIRMFT